LLSLAITSQSDKAEMLKTEGGCRQWVAVCLMPRLLLLKGFQHNKGP
jgi:hypothetical protein